MKYIAHRGLRDNKYEENTIEAFQNAIENPNVSGFEFDIRVTKDHYFVVHHNAFIKGDLIKNKTYRYLKKEYNLPLLSDVLKLETDKIMLIEIKDTHLPFKKLNRLLKKYSYRNLYVMSFHNSVIYKLCEYRCTAKLGILNYILNSEADYNLDFIGLINDLSNRKLIDNYKKREVEVFLYGVLNEEEDLRYEDVYYIVDGIPQNRNALQNIL